MAGSSARSEQHPKYPKRESFHAIRVLRCFLNSGALQRLGGDVFSLVAAVALTEDATRYTKPIGFHNEVLMSLLGVGSWRRLERIRRQAIEEGWICYSADKRGHRPGLYHTTIPPSVFDLQGSPDENSICHADTSNDIPNDTSDRLLNQSVCHGDTSNGTSKTPAEVWVCRSNFHGDTSNGISNDISNDIAFNPVPNPGPTTPPPNPLAVMVEGVEEKFSGVEEEAWRSFEAELRNLGMVATREPIANLREQGISPEEAREIVKFWGAKPTDYWPDRIQALRSKLMRAVRKEDVDAAWLQPAERYLQRDRDRRAEEQRQQRIRAAEESERSREAGNRSRLETSGALEEQFGPTLDALTRDEREDLINLACPSKAARQLYRTYWNRPGVHRNALLKRLAETATNRA